MFPPDDVYNPRIALADPLTDPRLRRLDVAADWWRRHDGMLYGAFALCCTLYAASLFYGYMLHQTRDVWSAPLDDVFIHFDYARSFARGFPFHWSEGNGYSSGNTSLTYPIVLAFGWWIGFRGLSLMIWAAFVACWSVLVFLVGAGALVTDALNAGDTKQGPAARWIRFLIPPAVLSMGALDWTLFSGMENAFHLGVWGACMLLGLWQTRATSDKQFMRRAWVVGIAGALFVATRPESAICVAAMGFYLAFRAHVLGRRGWRTVLKLLVAIGVPGIVFLIGHGAVNRVLTGEWAANGSVAKLFINNPFMTVAEKWERYTHLLDYIVPRLLYHHFGIEECGDWVAVIAVVPLAFRRTRPLAVFLWGQIVVWILVVSLNNQVRWHNERYAMPAVAWLLILAATGTGLLAAGGYNAWLNTQSKGWIAKLWPARIALAAYLVYFYWSAQAPHFKDQVWFFGRACRNILDQHVTAGHLLRRLKATRVLVGDAGALIYVSDLPGLDLIGLGGYHTYPFARSTVQGLGASLELVERIPRAERPDMMAIYPSWWGDLPMLFGKRVASVPVHGNVICGGAEKVLYRTDWRPLDRRGTPRTLLEGERIVDQLDVADLISERNHDYNFPKPQMGHIRFPCPARSEKQRQRPVRCGAHHSHGPNRASNDDGAQWIRAPHRAPRHRPTGSKRRQHQRGRARPLERAAEVGLAGGRGQPPR